MNRILFDVNIFMDVFEERHPHYPSSASILSLSEQKKVKGFISANSYSILYYLLSKKKGHVETINQLKILKQIVGIIPVDKKIIEKSLESNFSDLEDAIQYHCALNTKANSIITHDKKGFKHSKIPVLTPHEFLTNLTTKK